MIFKYRALLIVTPVVFFLDQLTKWLVRKYIPLHEAVPVVRGYFDIVHYENKGAAFGMFSGAGGEFRLYFFYVVSVLAVIILAGFFVKLAGGRLLPIAVSLIFGGIAGNTTDRIRFGTVTDFISVHISDLAWNFNIFGRQFDIPLEWPAFNVADSAITVAMFCLIIYAFKTERGDK
jgi:signal peptidase II